MDSTAWQAAKLFLAYNETDTAEYEIDMQAVARI